jgi:hypothetical protein
VRLSQIAFVFEGIEEYVGDSGAIRDKLLAGFDELSKRLVIGESGYTFGISMQNHVDVLAAALVDINIQFHGRNPLSTLFDIIIYPPGYKMLKKYVRKLRNGYNYSLAQIRCLALFAQK